MDQRRRGPRREGQRTTLRLPEGLMEAARLLAAELGTTTNDAIVRLAEEGAGARERRRRAEQLARDRREAVGRSSFPDPSEFPTPEALRDAMLSGRHES